MVHFIRRNRCKKLWTRAVVYKNAERTLLIDYLTPVMFHQNNSPARIMDSHVVPLDGNRRLALTFRLALNVPLTMSVNIHPLHDHIAGSRDSRYAHHTRRIPFASLS